MGRGHGRSGEEVMMLPLNEMPIRTGLEGAIGGLAFTDDPPNPWAIARTEELERQIDDGNKEDALFLLSNHVSDISTSPLLRRIAERLVESLLVDGEGEELEGYARRLMIISGAERATTDNLFGVTDRANGWKPMVHLLGEEGRASCGFDPTSDALRYRIHPRVPRGSLQDPPSLWSRCEECLDLAHQHPDGVESSHFSVLSANERKDIRQKGVARLVETLSARKKKPRRMQMTTLLLEVQKAVRETTHRALNAQIVNRLESLGEEEKFSRWFVHFVCDPNCSDSHQFDHVRRSIKSNYSDRMDEIPFPRKRDIYSALETMPRMPESDANGNLGATLIFLADLILTTWPAALPDIARDWHSTSKQQLYWRERWPEALEGVKIKGDLDY